MEANEWCAVVHVDIDPFSRLDEIERLLTEFVAAGNRDAGTIQLATLRQDGRPNHFEMIGRYASEAAYFAHLVTPINLAMRADIAALLGSPHEDRLHHPRGEQRWPSAREGDFVAITQVEIQPSALASALSVLDAVAETQSVAEGCRGTVLLQRHYVPNNLEAISVWSSPEGFDEHLASSAATRREELAPLLVAPIDDRRYELIAGTWATP